MRCWDHTRHFAFLTKLHVEAQEWKFSQVFGGDKSPVEEINDGNTSSIFVNGWLFTILLFKVDIVSAIEFNDTGEYIAAGDRGGRVVLFKRTDNNKLKVR